MSHPIGPCQTPGCPGSGRLVVLSNRLVCGACCQAAEREIARQVQAGTLTSGRKGWKR